MTQARSLEMQNTAHAAHVLPFNPVEQLDATLQPLGITIHSVVQRIFIDCFSPTDGDSGDSLADQARRFVAGHCLKTVPYAIMLARELGIDEETIANIASSAAVHDIGKVGGVIPYKLVLPDKPYSDGQYEIMQQHPTIGITVLEKYQLALPSDLYEMLYCVIYHHHERFDGRGYPKGLKGKNIPLASLIMTVADSWQAMGDGQRKYNHTRTPQESITELQTYKLQQFDEDIIAIVWRLFKEGKWR